MFKGQLLGFLLILHIFFVKPIVDLHEHDIDSKLQTGESWVLEFCSSYPECQEFNPIYEALAKKFPGTRFGRVDVSKQTDLKERFHVKQLPAVFYIRDRQLREFDLELTLENLVFFIEKDYINVTPEDIPQTETEVQLVYQLSSSNFDRTIERGRWIVQIGAQSCEHCKGIELFWNDVASVLFKDGSDINVAFLDESRAGDIADRYQIAWIPTFLFFDQGKFSEYTGTASIDELLEFLKANMTACRSLPQKDFAYVLRYEYYEHYLGLVRHNLKLSLMISAVMCVMVGFLTGYNWNIARPQVKAEQPELTKVTKPNIASLQLSKIRRPSLSPQPSPVSRPASGERYVKSPLSVEGTPRTGGTPRTPGSGQRKNKTLNPGGETPRTGGTPRTQGSGDKKRMRSPLSEEGTPRTGKSSPKLPFKMNNDFYVKVNSARRK